MDGETDTVSLTRKGPLFHSGPPLEDTGGRLIIQVLVALRSKVQVGQESLQGLRTPGAWLSPGQGHGPEHSLGGCQQVGSAAGHLSTLGSVHHRWEGMGLCY